MTACVAHMDVCMRVAEKGYLLKKSLYSAAKYDELRRKQLEEKARNGAPGLDIPLALATLDQEVMAQAFSTAEAVSCSFHSILILTHGPLLLCRSTTREKEEESPAHQARERLVTARARARVVGARRTNVRTSTNRVVVGKTSTPPRRGSGTTVKTTRETSTRRRASSGEARYNQFSMNPQSTSVLSFVERQGTTATL